MKKQTIEVGDVVYVRYRNQIGIAKILNKSKYCCVIIAEPQKLIDNELEIEISIICRKKDLTLISKGDFK